MLMLMLINKKNTSQPLVHTLMTLQNIDYNEQQATPFKRSKMSSQDNADHKLSALVMAFRYVTAL